MASDFHPGWLFRRFPLRVEHSHFQNVSLLNSLSFFVWVFRELMKVLILVLVLNECALVQNGENSSIIIRQLIVFIQGGGGTHTGCLKKMYTHYGRMYLIEQNIQRFELYII